MIAHIQWRINPMAEPAYAGGPALSGGPAISDCTIFVLHFFSTKR